MARSTLNPEPAKKDGHTFGENLGTQPLVRHRVFNNTHVVTEGWYVVCKSSAVKKGQARSQDIFHQRIVLYRGYDGQVRCLDAFCPHMGADLGNGTVVDNELRCYFHRWQFNSQGRLTVVPNTDRRPKNACVKAWPVEEKYGHIWVYAGAEAPYPVPHPPGLDDCDVDTIRLASPVLYAHHHVMMAGGIDLQHFATVHDLDIEFDYSVEESRSHVFDWKLSGDIPTGRLKYSLMKKIVGERVGYDARFAGGTICTLTYGPNQRFGGTGFRLPPLHILWGCVPLTSGVSQVHIFLATKKRKGLFGWLQSKLLFLLTVVLLTVLRDDDVKAFPHMRFNPKNLIDADRSVARFIQLTNGLPISVWSGPEHADATDAENETE